MSLSPWDWPLSWRAAILLNVGFYNWMGNAFAAGIAVVFPLIIPEFGVSQEDASRLSTYALLTLGLSNLFALPLASIIGKRYSILLSQAVFLASCLWSAEAKTFNSLLASRIVGGLAGGMIEALGPTIVAETFREQALARAMVVYVGLLAAGSNLGPFFAGCIAQGLGSWRWFMWVLAILTAANLVGSILMLPETTHQEVEFQGPIDMADEPQKAQQLETVERAEPEIPPAGTLKREWVKRSFTGRYVAFDWRQVAIAFHKPFELLLAPQILVTTLVFGLTIGWSVIISILVPTAYSPPPYLWGAFQVGLLNLAPFIGIVVGLPIGGPLADMLSNQAWKKRGMHDAADRFPALLPGALLSPAGCVLVGFGLQSPDRWILLAVGWAMLSIGLTDSANVLLTYCVDCLPSRATHIGALINIAKNCVAFGTSYASISWMESMGPVKQFATMGSILGAAYIAAIIVWVFNKPLSHLISRFV
ncbi:MFS general substrate transporter [Thozetella sp. PMI_491]|nr:MFS general substrate transporter [Thozetella sp. PMI_491]